MVRDGDAFYLDGALEILSGPPTAWPSLPLQAPHSRH